MLSESQIYYWNQIIKHSIIKFPKKNYSGNWIKPWYCNKDEMINDLSEGTFYQKTHFSEDVVEEVAPKEGSGTPI